MAYFDLTVTISVDATGAYDSGTLHSHTLYVLKYLCLGRETQEVN